MDNKPISLVSCEDNMLMMARYPDKFFDLAIVDPPYGIGSDWEKRNKGKRFAKTSYKNKIIPDALFFSELFRVSKDQIIWGYNYYTDLLGPTNYLICWDKMSNNNDVFKYSKFELAYTSIKIPANIIKIPWDGYRMGNETGISKIHPHQKPLKLYKWLLSKYGKKGRIILDTHMGSQSSRIASYQMGFDYYGCEIDPVYFELGNKRFINQTAQLPIFKK